MSATPPGTTPSSRCSATSPSATISSRCAIELAWNLITKEFGLPKDKLLVTVFSEDDEAFDLWKKIAGLPEIEDHPHPDLRQFLADGRHRPLRPVLRDLLRPRRAASPAARRARADEDGDRFIEIWNLVFMQYEQIRPGERIALPKPSIDTGMGLERIAAVLQGTHDNYDTDLFRALIGAVADLTDVAADGPQKASHRVIADHLRASSFLVADGVLPSNEGRGYVLRRIMRRAMRHAQLLGAKDPLMYRLVPALVREMGQAYPELVRAEPLITETLQLEESRFRKTLERGLVDPRRGDRATSCAGQKLSGEIAFTLYDTYGFPARPDAGRAAIARHRRRHRRLRRGDGAPAREGARRLGRLRARRRPRRSGSACASASARPSSSATTPRPPRASSSRSSRTAARSTSSTAGESGLVVLNQTPFYGESGGQVGDTGTMTAVDVRVRVADTQKKLGDLFVHHVVGRGGRAQGRPVRSSSPSTTPAAPAIRANHSATHLLHEALRQVLGDHVAQKGSLVAPDRLRFDFSHPKPIGDDELAARRGHRQRGAPAERAGGDEADGGRRGDRVRRPRAVRREIRRRGPRRLDGQGTRRRGRQPRPSRSSSAAAPMSSRTGDIGVIAVVSEGAVAAGVRRLEAMTGDAARRHLAAESRKLHEIAGLLKTPVEEAPERLAALIEERRKLERELAEARRKLAMGGGAAAAIRSATSAA